MSVELERVVQFLDDTLEVPDFPDYPNALNGLQVGGPTDVSRVATAVDASLQAVRAAAGSGADLLIVHHGLFWGGVRPVTGAFFEKLAALIEGSVGLYSAHLPLDAHPELGNSAVLSGHVGIDLAGPFGQFEGREVGWWGRVDCNRDELRQRLARQLGGDVRVIAGGPERLRRVAVVTGGAASFLESAAEEGMDALITGEGSHHSYHDAMELGVNLYLGGHYATETWGVRALGDLLAEEFGVATSFIDLPTGL